MHYKDSEINCKSSTIIVLFSFLSVEIFIRQVNTFILGGAYPVITAKLTTRNAFTQSMLEVSAALLKRR
jgi:hypothetical protein